MKKKIVLICISGILWSQMCLVWAANKGPSIPPVFVETITLKPTVNTEQIMAIGTLLAIPGVVIRPEIAGRITKIYFHSGAIVKQGGPLIEINPEILRAQLASAQAKLRLERLNFTRMQDLYKKRVISKSDLEQAQENYHVARSGVDEYQARLQQAIITAPFTGKLGLSKVTAGDYVNVGQEIVSLQTVDPLRVDFSIPEVSLPIIAAGEKVILHADAYPQENFVGVVEAYDSAIDKQSRTLNVRANVPNREGKLIPGGFVKVALQVGKKMVLSVPQTAITYTSEGTYIYRIVNNKAEKIAVKLGEKDSNSVVVKEGLKAGDVVITAGQMKLYPGAKVIVAPSQVRPS